MADWVRVVGLDAMRGFEFADTPDRPVTGTDTLRLGGRTIVITHPGAGHTAGDLMVWLPKERVLFAGDLLVEDGVTMVVDGNSRELLKALDAIDALRPDDRGPGTRRHSGPARAISWPSRGLTSPALQRRHAGRGRARRADEARDGLAPAGRREAPGVARLAQATKCRAGLSGGGEEIHGPRGFAAMRLRKGRRSARAGAG